MPNGTMPNLLRCVCSSPSVPPYTGLVCSTASPGSRNAWVIALIAAMPQLNTAASSAPSSTASRACSIDAFGWSSLA